MLTYSLQVVVCTYKFIPCLSDSHFFSKKTLSAQEGHILVLVQARVWLSPTVLQILLHAPFTMLEFMRYLFRMCSLLLQH